MVTCRKLMEKKFYTISNHPSHYLKLKDAMEDAKFYAEDEITLYMKQEDTDWYKKGVYVKDGLGWQYVPWKYYSEITHRVF